MTAGPGGAAGGARQVPTPLDRPVDRFHRVDA